MFNSNNINSTNEAYLVKNAGTLYANGTYNYAGEYNGKPYYTYNHYTGILPDGPKHYTTMYLSYRSGTSGWGITESQLSGTITPLYYQSVISETPDLGTFACATGASPAPEIVKSSGQSNESTTKAVIGYKIENSGCPEIHGEYMYLDEYNGKPRYQMLDKTGMSLKIEYRLSLNSFGLAGIAGWMIATPGIFPYYAIGADSPDKVPWQVYTGMGGVAPVPTFTPIYEN